MGRYGKLDYPKLTKYGFGLGVGLFCFGALGALLGPLVFGSLPGWEAALFVDSEAVGILVAFLSVLLFGIVLPLTE